MLSAVLLLSIERPEQDLPDSDGPLSRPQPTKPSVLCSSFRFLKLAFSFRSSRRPYASSMPRSCIPASFLFTADKFADVLGTQRGGGVARTNELFGETIAQTVSVGDITPEQYRMLPRNCRLALDDLLAAVDRGDEQALAIDWSQSAMELDEAGFIYSSDDEEDEDSD